VKTEAVGWFWFHLAPLKEIMSTIETHTKLEIGKKCVDMGFEHIERGLKIIQTAPEHERKMFLHTLVGLGIQIESFIAKLELQK